MQDPVPGPEDDLSQEYAALFEQLVTGHGQMAMMCLGCLENPQTGHREVPDLLGAKVFIDQLYMLRDKTRGNLSERERDLLQETLDATQTAFVQVATESEESP